jgi:hypothetical protein
MARTIIRFCKSAAPEMDGIVNLGRDFYAFVRPINKYIIMPVFNFFERLGFCIWLGDSIAYRSLSGL